MNEINVVHFSPSGTTKTISTALARAIRDKIAVYDILKHPQSDDVSIVSSSPTVFAMPVFAGRIPEVCVDELKHFSGNGTAAIAVVVYGNRAYDDALFQLTEILSENGFVVVAAAAFVAQHSIFTQAAHGRPDESDMEKVDEFATQCRTLLGSFTGNETIEVSGKHPYGEPSSVPLVPKTSSKCDRCGACVNICPRQAIDADNPRKTIKALCIACTACITVCPQHARAFGGPMFATAAPAFVRRNAKRKEPEFFYAK